MFKTNVWYNVFGGNMKINKIIKNKNGKYKIIFDNKESLTTYDDVILNNGILFKKELTEEELNKVTNENNYYDIYNKTLKFISVRIRSLKEVDLFLNKQEVTASVRDSIVKKLQEINLINDERFACAYFQDRLNLSNDGPYKIQQELKNNNIDGATIEGIFSKSDQQLVYEKLDKLIQKKIKSNHNKSNFMLKQKIVNDMINLGYDKSMIVTIMENRLMSNDEIINKEYNKLKNKLSKKYFDHELEKQIKLKLQQRGFSLDEINSIKKEDYN